MTETLLLTRGYEPIDRISWQRAVGLWWRAKVEIVEAYEDRVVRAPSLELAMPSVVRVLDGFRPGRLRVTFSRANVYARDRGECQYCGKKLARPDSTYDHVVPRRLGGRTTWDNIVIACLPCNQAKGGRTPEQAGMTLRSIPVRPGARPAALRLRPEEVPKTWRQYFLDDRYWNGRLEER